MQERDVCDINVGGGTNRNEAFHRYINTFFHKSRLGILLYALMMTIIHQYNSKFRNNRKCVFVPVQKSQPDNVIESDEPMGIAPSTESVSDHSWNQKHSDSDTISTSFIVDILSILISAENVQMYEIADQNSFTYIEVHTICANAAMHSSGSRCIT